MKRKGMSCVAAGEEGRKDKGRKKNEHVSCRSICEAGSNIGGAYLRDLRSSLSGFNERPSGT